MFNSLNQLPNPCIPHLPSSPTTNNAAPMSPTFCPPPPPSRNLSPRLILAPMEVLADRQFRFAISSIGGMHEAVHEFIRITTPNLSSIRGILKQKYNPHEISPIPLAPQLMGGHPEAMLLAADELATFYKPHRIDLNCGCPSRRVNGRGAGASLLKVPDGLYNVVRGMVEGVRGRCVVSVKMRSGYDDVDLFVENLRAVVQAGAGMVTIHPRTKKQGYGGRADWELIKVAKEVVGEGVELIGNGDVENGDDADRMLRWTGCDGVMVGRGAVKNPWVFWEIRERLGMEGGGRKRCLDGERGFWERYMDSAGGVDEGSSTKVHRMKIGRFKMLVGFANSIEEEEKRRLRRFDADGDARRYLDEVLKVVAKHYGV